LKSANTFASEGSGSWVCFGILFPVVRKTSRPAPLNRAWNSSALWCRRSISQTFVGGLIKYSGWFSPVSGSADNEYKQDHVAPVRSAIEDTSESKAGVKAKLSGEVRVNFESDYFPMDKMASPQMIAAIQANAKADKV
jgi:hypothetical protein